MTKKNSNLTVGLRGLSKQRDFFLVQLIPGDARQGKKTTATD